jgi:GcrA cell cycle regulator
MTLTTNWTDERVAELTRLYNIGFSAAQTAVEISKTFGLSVTRNAVIGIWNRRGLTGDGGKMRRRVRVVRANGNSEAMKVFDLEMGEMREVRAADVVPLHVSLAALEAGQCRYPYGDGPFTFCGCQALPGKPYCPPHHMLTWTKSRTPLPRPQTAPFKIVGSLLGSFS